MPRRLRRPVCDAAVDTSVKADVVGASLTILYMVVYYKLLGVADALSPIRQRPEMGRCP
ncbi:MAG TPA: hypothetical protein VLL25_09135 [Acidimicrobiales bacterium]|nr:hypothetical protein [Acidimicrobiales bacterium]